MKNTIWVFGVIMCTLLLIHCTGVVGENEVTNDSAKTGENANGGFESQVAWGEHLVVIGGCNDCHTPKKMSDHGPILDSSLWLSGHPSGQPRIDVDRKAMESKGLVVTQTLTEWVGPWGVSFAANLTPDVTGIANWTEAQFMYALREGKYKGLANSRPLLPPMPWEMYMHMTDDEIKAMFAYLKSIKAINNVVPPPVPPASAS